MRSCKKSIFPGQGWNEAATRYNLAMVYRNQKRLEEAAAELRQVVELDRQTGSPDLESDLAMLREVKGEQNKGS